MTANNNPLYTAVFLMEITAGLFLLVASVLAAQLIDSPFLLGLIGVVHVGTKSLGIFFGRLSDRIGRKFLLILSMFLILLSFIILGFQEKLFVILSYFSAGVAIAIFWPLIEAWIGHGSHDEDLLKQLGSFGLFFTIGLTVGNLSGGYFMKITPTVSIIFGAFLSVVIGLIFLVTPDHKGTHHSETDNKDPIYPEESVSAGVNAASIRTETAPRTVLDPEKLRIYRYAGWVANFATYSVIGIMRFLFTKLCLELGLSSEIIGYINAVLYCTWFVTFFILVRYKGWLYRPVPLITFQFVGILAMLVMGLFPSKTIFFAGAGLFGLSAGVTYLSSIFYGQNGTEQKGNNSGIHEVVLGLGMLIGPFIGGIIAELTSLNVPFLFSAVLILAAITTEVFLWKRAAAKNRISI